MKRRELVQTALGTLGGALVGCHVNADLPAAALATARPTGAAAPVVAPSTVDLELTLRAQPSRLSLLDGPATEVWHFSAHLEHGMSDAVVASDSSYLGPTLKVKRGQRVRVHFENSLDEATIVHWHGLDVDAKNDGHPSYGVGPGGQYSYDFEVRNRAGTYWYHAHPDGRTGPQVYRGLAGLLLVSDDDEQRLALPDGDRELTLVLQDRTFDDGNQLVYAPNAMRGFLGEQVLVSGEFPRTKELPGGPHRLRILNGSNSRIYDLGWSDGSPLTVLGTDGGLLDAPLDRSHVVLAPGQRLDVWANFGGGVSDDVWLESRRFEDPGSAMGMGGGVGGRGAVGVANGAPLRIQRFVARSGGSPARPPKTLTTSFARRELEMSGAITAKTFPIGHALALERRPLPDARCRCQ